MGSPPRIASLRHALAPSRARTLVAAVAVLAALTAFLAASGHARAADPLGALQSQLGAQQARQGSLQGSIATLNATIGSLDDQIAIVEGREADVRAALTREQAALVQVRGELAAERTRLAMLRRRLAAARVLLAAQLRSGYEAQRPSLVNVVLAAHGFNDLLEQLSFLGRAEGEQTQLITLTAQAKHAATTVAARLTALRARDAEIQRGSELEARALAGMNALLATKQGALARARGAEAQALAVSRETSARLRSRIASVQAAQRAAALRAAQARAAQAAAAARAAATAGASTGGGGGGGGATSGAGGSGAAAPASGSGGWAIPEPIVMCESGGQDLPPNSAGASGYYQIIPGTWRLFGGTGPAAWLASRAEQSAVATRIWNGGAGATNWVCAGIVGIH